MEQPGKLLQVHRLDSVVKLLRHADLVAEMIHLTRGRDNEHSESDIFGVLRNRVAEEGFGIFLQTKGSEDVGMAAYNVSETLFGTRQCFCWLMRVRAGGDGCRLNGVAMEWARHLGARSLVAFDDTFGEAKDRWMRKNGMKLDGRVYSLRLD